MKKTKQIQNIIASGLVAIIATASSLKAETILLYDDSFAFIGVPSLAAGGILSARWGQWDVATNTFNQAIVNSLNAGYVDLSSPEMSVGLNQTDSTTYGTGALLAMAIFASNSSDSQSLSWSLTPGGAKQASVVAWAVLTDSSWVAPAFTNSGANIPFTFTANTQAVIGTFSGGAAGGLGEQTITLIPEPSSASLLVLGVAGLVALRARRKS